MRIYRKRLFPKELIELKNDQIIYQDDAMVVTVWKTIRPRGDMDHGISAYFIEEGWKISKFYRSDGSLVYWYCDIGKYDLEEGTDSLVFTDLLADVIIHPNETVRVVDLQEAADSFEAADMSPSDVCWMLRRLNALLEKIYNGSFKRIQEKVESFEN